MNFSDLPSLEPDINELKNQLAKLCEQYKISRFEPEDIVELLEDGEDVGWIIGQLRQDNDQLDAETLGSVLSSIASIVTPPEDEIVAVEEPSIATEENIELASEETQPMDLSQIDLSRLGEQMEALTGMKLPPGVDMNQIKKVMESPRGAFLTDFGVFCQEQGIDMNSVSDPSQLQTLNEQWMATPRTAFDGKTPAEVSEGDSSLMSFKKVETYRREQPRIGRNDPCPCGSGKKYKKCCGRGK